MMNKRHSSIFIAIFFLATGFNSVYADKVAIIGGGAAGLVTAWLIEQNHDVTLYEAKSKLGGHADSVEINVDGAPVVIEAGTEFFNDDYYPHFMRLLHYYHIPLRSFSLVTTFYNTDGTGVIILPPYHDNKIEWKSLTPDNLFTAVQLKCVVDNGRKLIAAHDTTTTFAQFVDSLSVTKNFKTNFLYPLMAAAWGVTPEDVQNFSAFNTLRYIVEGDDVKGKWYEVTGGLKVYIDAVQHSLTNTEVRLNAKVKQISKVDGHYVITAEDGTSRQYDQVVFATDASVASSLLSQMPETVSLSNTLKQIQYYDTKIAIHGDKRFMPPLQDDWRVANVRYDGVHAMMTTYKYWKSKTPIFRSWITYDVRSPNDHGDPMPQNLYAVLDYRHPVIDHNYFSAQSAIRSLEGNQNLWFAGMWTYDNDSHESAVSSAMLIGEKLAPNSPRLKILEG